MKKGEGKEAEKGRRMFGIGFAKKPSPQGDGQALRGPKEVNRIGAGATYASRSWPVPL